MLFDNINDKNENRHVFDIKKYINQYFDDNQLSLKTISVYIGLSVPQMCLLFKNETEDTIGNYIVKTRILKAKELLVDKSLSINDIFGRCGFSDAKHFSKTFKKETGVSPSTFRMRYLP